MNDFNQATIIVNFEKKEDMIHMQLQAVCKNGEDVKPMDGNMLLNLLANSHNQVLAQIEKQNAESKLDMPSVPASLEKETETDALPEDETSEVNSDEPAEEEETILVPTTTTLQ